MSCAKLRKLFQDQKSGEPEEFLPAHRKKFWISGFPASPDLRNNPPPPREAATKCPAPQPPGEVARVSEAHKSRHHWNNKNPQKCPAPHPPRGGGRGGEMNPIRSVMKKGVGSHFMISCWLPRGNAVIVLSFLA